MSRSRPKQLKIRLSDGEQEMLRLLALGHGITVSDYVRMMIDREGAALRELLHRKLDPLEFSYQAELLRRGIESGAHVLPEKNGGRR